MVSTDAATLKLAKRCGAKVERLTDNLMRALDERFTPRLYVYSSGGALTYVQGASAPLHAVVRDYIASR